MSEEFKSRRETTDWTSMQTLAEKFNRELTGAILSPEEDMFTWSTKDGSRWCINQLEKGRWQVQKQDSDGVFWFVTKASWPAALELALKEDWDESGVEIDVL